MNPAYAINDISSIYSPGLLFYKDLIRRNIGQTIEIAGAASRLRPHVKTHKTREIVRMAMAAGILKHKCADPGRSGNAGRLRRDRCAAGL